MYVYRSKNYQETKIDEDAISVAIWESNHFDWKQQQNEGKVDLFNTVKLGYNDHGYNKFMALKNKIYL